MQPVYVVSKPVPIALALMLCATWLFGQNRSLAPTGKDFPFAGGNLGTQRYSVLTQNDQSNVNKLGGAWMGVHVGGGGIVFTATVTDSAGTMSKFSRAIYLSLGERR